MGLDPCVAEYQWVDYLIPLNILLGKNNNVTRLIIMNYE